MVAGEMIGDLLAALTSVHIFQGGFVSPRGVQMVLTLDPFHTAYQMGLTFFPYHLFSKYIFLES